MMDDRLTILGAALLALALSTPAQADDAQAIVVKASPHPVAETLDRLTGALEKKGITVFARIDHAAGAKKVGLELRPNQVLIFGNPKLGTPLMQARPGVGLDLPMKVQAFEDPQGQVWVRYVRPAGLLARHGGGGPEAVVAKMTGALDAFTDAAIAP